MQGFTLDWMGAHSLSAIVPASLLLLMWGPEGGIRASSWALAETVYSLRRWVDFHNIT
jgi:hypothetical protein